MRPALRNYSLSSASTRSRRSFIAPRGITCSVSHRESVACLTPNRSAKALWLSPNRSRAALISSPDTMTHHQYGLYSYSQYQMYAPQCKNLGMEPCDRLVEARKRLFPDSAASAARAMGIKNVSTYNHHENGRRGLTRKTARRYADFFKVNVDWLLYSKGPRDRHSPAGSTSLEGFDELSPEAQEAIRGMIKVMLQRRGV